MTIISDRPASSRIDPNISLPPDLDPEINPIIARHFYGVDLRDVRETWWSFARQGVELPDEWMSREADRFREMCLMPPIPQKVRDQWEAWKAKRKGWGKAEIQVEYDRLCAEQKAALAAAPHRHP